MFQLIVPAIVGAVTEAIIKESQRPEVPVDPRDAARVAAAVTRTVAEDPKVKEIEQRVAHVTSTEPWYKSRANWSAIVAGLTPIIALLGYNLAPEDQATIAGVLTIAGNAVAAYLARRARTATKPLGA